MTGRGLSEQNILDAILELESEEEDNLELELCNFDEASWDSVADPEYQPETEELNDVEQNLIHGIIRCALPAASNCFLPQKYWKRFWFIQLNIQRENYNDKSHAVMSNLEMDELEAFLCLLVLSAATHMMFDTIYCGERYKATMPERRLKFILNCLRFDDKETRTARREMTKLAPVSSIWDKLLNNCRVNYKPGSYITIDEQLVGFRGKCPFRMYIPSKPNKYGIKMVMSCDSGTKYMLDAIVYLGKGRVPPAMAAGEYYVVELLKNVKGTNRNVTIDNWFTSVPLIQHLRHEYKITTVGTIKKK